MATEIRTRFESKSFYDTVQKSSFTTPDYESVTGYLSLRKPTSPLPTIELDEDSFWLAYSDWSSCAPQAVSRVQPFTTTLTISL